MHDINVGQYVRSGALAGVVATLVFMIIHDIFISDIWYMLMVMLIAGAVCGLCVSWSYALLPDRPTMRRWLGYNLLYVVMFVLLGVSSVVVYEPVTTVAALAGSDGPPDKLIGQALPMTAVFTLVAAVLISWLYGRTWSRFGAILLTCVVLVILLGLNVSVIGLVAFPHGSFYLVAELFGLIVALNVVYTAVFLTLERKSLRPVTAL